MTIGRAIVLSVRGGLEIISKSAVHLLYGDLLNLVLRGTLLHLQAKCDAGKTAHPASANKSVFKLISFVALQSVALDCMHRWDD